MKYNHLIIDINNLFWRATVHSLSKIMNKDIVDDNLFYSATISDCLDRFNQLRNTYGDNNTVIYALHDNPFSKINERELIDSSYKHARKNKNIPPIFYKSLDRFIEILKVYINNLYIVSYSNCEADDLVLPVLNHIGDDSVLMISADMDWSRGISEKIHWFNFHNIYSKDNFTEKYGFNPENNGVKLYKAIHGDKSDCIENAVPHLPKTVLYHIIDSYSDIYDLLNHIWRDEEIPKQWKHKIKDAEIQLKINYQLVDFLPIDLNFNEIAIEAKENINELRSWFELMGLQKENRMIDPKKDAHAFLERKKYKRIVSI